MGEVTTLGRLASEGRLLVNDGYRTKADELGTPGLPILRVAEVQNGFLQPSFGDHVRMEYRTKFGGKTSQADDVVVTTKGTVGRVARVRSEHPEFVYSPQVCFFRALPNGGIDPGFLYYWFRGAEFREQALGVQAQTDMAPYINLADMRSVRITLPPVSEQRALAAVLGALDDKIESNRRVVDGIGALGALELAVALGGRDRISWEYSWPEVPLGTVLDVIESGSRPAGGVARYTEGVPSVGAESIVRAGVFDYSKTRYVPVEYFEKMNRGVLQSGDVLLYKDGGTPGNFIPHVSMAQDGFPFDRAAINEHVYRLRIKPPYSQAFLYYWLSSRRMTDEMWLRGTGAAIPGLNSTNVKELPIIVPDEAVLGAVLPVLDDMVAALHRAAREKRTLEELRDALLGELLSGRLRVLDAEDWVEELV